MKGPLGPEGSKVQASCLPQFRAASLVIPVDLEERSMHQFRAKLPGHNRGHVAGRKVGIMKPFQFTKADLA